MITGDQLGEMVLDELSASALREELAVGLREETEEDRRSIRRNIFRAFAVGMELDAIEVVLHAASDEVIVPSSCHEDSILWCAVITENRQILMAVVERMRKNGLRVANIAPFRTLYKTIGFVEHADVDDAVISVTDPSVFEVVTEENDALVIAIDSHCMRRVAAVDMVLKHGPSMAQRLEAGVERFRYVHAAARNANFYLLLALHHLLPVLSDGSGRRGELADYARAIELAAGNDLCKDVSVLMTIVFLAEQAGDDEVFALCSPTFLLTCRNSPTVRWMVERAPQMVEAACRDPNCLTLLVTKSRETTFLVEQMVELVDPKLLCSMMRQEAPPYVAFLPKGWRMMLGPIHEAVPESMDGLRWKWLVQAILNRSYGDVEYLLGMCTREHLVTRNEDGDTAYDIAAKNTAFPMELLQRLKVVTKGAHG